MQKTTGIHFTCVVNVETGTTISSFTRASLLGSKWRATFQVSKSKKFSVTILFLSLLMAFRPKKLKAVLPKTIVTSFEASIPGLLMPFLTVFGARVSFSLLKTRKSLLGSACPWLEIFNKASKVIRLTISSCATSLLNYFGKGWLLCKILCLDVPYC